MCLVITHIYAIGQKTYTIGREKSKSVVSVLFFKEDLGVIQNSTVKIIDTRC